jgi:hypothetical protein
MFVAERDRHCNLFSLHRLMVVERQRPNCGSQPKGGGAGLRSWRCNAAKLQLAQAPTCA